MTLSFLSPKVNWTKAMVGHIGRLGEFITFAFPTWVPGIVLIVL